MRFDVETRISLSVTLATCIGAMVQRRDVAKMDQKKETQSRISFSYTDHI